MLKEGGIRVRLSSRPYTKLYNVETTEMLLNTAECLHELWLITDRILYDALP